MKFNLKANTAVFIDTNIDNYQQLLNGVLPEVRPFVLKRGTDGVRQIDEILKEHPEINDIHIISHGSSGCLYLGNSQLSLDTLDYYASQLQGWRLDKILLYGCQVAAGDAGAELVEKLHNLTGAKIGASKSLTGATAKGGNWELEVSTDKKPLVAVLQPEVMASYDCVLNFELEWAFNIGGSFGNDQINEIAIDSKDNILVTGTFGDLAEYDTIDINSDGINDLTTNGGPIAYVVKFDVDGNLVFARNIGYPHSYHLIRGIATDNNDNVLVTGDFSGKLDLNSDGVDDLSSSNNSSYIAKFDREGNLIFARNIGNSGFNSDITSDSSGNILIASDGVNDLTGDNSYIAKLDPNGNLIFARNIGHQALDLATDGSGNVWVSGYFYSDTIDIDSDGVDDFINKGDIDSYIAKFDRDGNFLFSQQIGSRNRDSIHDIATDSSGNIWLMGGFGTTLDFNSGSLNFHDDTIDIDSDGIDDLTSNEDRDGFLVKLDGEGNLLFAQNFDAISDDITVDDRNDVWLVSYKGYITKFDSQGNLVLTENIGESAFGIAIGNNGKIWLSGSLGNDLTLPEDVSENTVDINADGIDDLTANGGYDGYIAKLSQDDLIYGGVEDDLLNGEAGNDKLFGNQGNDTLNGGEDNDVLRGRPAEDLLQGDGGNDKLFGNQGNDTLNGGDGDDTLNGGTNDDLLNGEAGNDKLFGSQGNDTLNGGEDNDILRGRPGEDLLQGDGGNDKLFGNQGNDTLSGGDGDDTLKGGTNDDLLDGGAGSDRLYGNAGSDTFVLEPGIGRDSIYDFADSIDFIQLKSGLNFSDLEIESVRNSTVIKVAEGGDHLAILRGVDVALIGEDDFTVA